VEYYNPPAGKINLYDDYQATDVISVLADKLSKTRKVRG